MELSILKNQIAKEIVKNKLLQFAVILIAASNIIFGFMAYTAVKHKTVVLIPVGFDKKIEVGNRLNKLYILEMSRFIFDSFLNYTPGTVRKQYEVVLSLFAPETYQKYHKIFSDFVSDAELSHISSVFFIKKISFSPAKRFIKVEGKKITILDDQIVGNIEQSYALIYKIHYGRFEIVEFGKYNAIKKYIKEM